MTQPQTPPPWRPLDTVTAPSPIHPLTTPPTLTLLTLLTLLTTISFAALAIHRLYLSPLAPFPGPTHAALTSLVEFHDNVLHSGRFVWRLRAWHARYGPIVRISPTELHVADPAFHAALADIVGACALGDGFGLLEREDMGEEWWRLMLDLSRNTHLMNHVGFIYTLFTWLPQQLVALVHPLTTQLFDVQNSIDARIREAKASLSSTSPSPSSSSAEKTIPACHAPAVAEDAALLRYLLTAYPTLHSGTALPDELFTILGAGTLSTSHALSVLLYHVHAHPPYLSRLRSELLPLYTSPSPAPSPSPPTRPSLAALHSLPFLTACITEALRLSHGVAGRLPRVAPDDDLTYTDPASGRAWRVPRGTTVSMTHMFMHLDEQLFAAPADFVPERWMGEEDGGSWLGEGAGEDVAQMKRHFAPFGRGSRACVGRDVAVAVMAAVVGEVVGGLWVGGGGGGGGGGGVDDNGARHGSAKQDEAKQDEAEKEAEKEKEQHDERTAADAVHLQLFHTDRAEVEVARDWFGGVSAAGLRCRGVRMRVLRRRGGDGELVEDGRWIDI
ncbi:cytochrome P450 [Phyllosticta citrichinensis]